MVFSGLQKDDLQNFHTYTCTLNVKRKNLVRHDNKKKKTVQETNGNGNGNRNDAIGRQVVD